jgi:hypothetical protein
VLATVIAPVAALRCTRPIVPSLMLVVRLLTSPETVLIDVLRMSIALVLVVVLVSRPLSASPTLL